MKANKLVVSIALLGLGAVLMAAGFLISDPALKTIAGVCIGIGAGLVGMSAANIWMELYYQKNPRLKRTNEIEARDERTQLITDKSKARAYEVMMRILIVVPFILILIEAPLWATLATILVYLSGFGVQLFFIGRYSRQM